MTKKAKEFPRTTATIDELELRRLKKNAARRKGSARQAIPPLEVELDSQTFPSVVASKRNRMCFSGASLEGATVASGSSHAPQPLPQDKEWHNTTNISHCTSISFSDGSPTVVPTADISSATQRKRLRNEPCHELLHSPKKLRGRLNIFPSTASSSFDCSSNANDSSATLVADKCCPRQPSTLQRRPKRLCSLLNIPSIPYTLPAVPECEFCGAFRFAYEPPGFCCSSGEVSFLLPEAPPILSQLFSGDNAESEHFLKYTRVYNNMFSFTSFGVTRYDRQLATAAGTGIYVFKVQGQVYHYVNQLLPVDNVPRNFQLYFYDPCHEEENRRALHSAFEESVVQKLTDVVNKNPYARFFRSLSDVPNLEDRTIVIRGHPKLDQHVYNKPTTNDIAFIWVEGVNQEPPGQCDIMVHGRSEETHRVFYHYSCYDPLQYPLLFPNGEPGWHNRIRKCVKRKRKRKRKHAHAEDMPMHPSKFRSATDFLLAEKQVAQFADKDRSQKYVSMREYYAFLLQIRRPHLNNFLAARRLLQQFIVDVYAKIETQKLDFYRFNQDHVRAEQYQNLLNSLATGETSAAQVGKRVVLPSSFIGGPRDLRNRYLDAMALVSNFGKPDLFITMTCNPDWPEIVSNLEKGQTAQDRPDLVARVFRAKIEELKRDLFAKKLFGSIAAYVYVVEFQKRGNPHIHMLIILEGASKLQTIASYDNIVCAELPDLESESYLYSLVVQHMIHGPCGKLNPMNSCMLNDKKACKSFYPKAFQSVTEKRPDEYIAYRRRRNGREVYVRGSKLDNRWVVPYNPYLLAKYNCHINVEICSSVTAVKYLYKYLYKGPDKVAFSVAPKPQAGEINEITDYEMGRWICPQEAFWRLYEFKLYGMRPPVLALQLHLEHHNLVSYRSSNKIQNVVRDESSEKTMLTEFFRLNASDPDVRALQLLYEDFPKYFTWTFTPKMWKKRKTQPNIGRINNASPLEVDRFFLKLLLKHVRAPTSFDDLLVYRGVVASSYKEAAELRGLLVHDKALENAMEDGILYKMPCELRHLFASLLSVCKPSDGHLLWEKYKHSLCEDYLRSDSSHNGNAESRALADIAATLESVGKNIRAYNLIPNIEKVISEHINKEISDELAIPVDVADLESVSKLNNSQKLAFDAIMNAIKGHKGQAFFIDGPGGTGKTFLYRALLAVVRSSHQVALATASSGVAASLLPGGRTAHSRFKIPIDITQCRTCNVSKQSGLANLIREAKLIIWDEATMANKTTIEMFDRLLQDLHDNECLFGGKVVVFGGDFRQVLPVVAGQPEDHALDASIVMSYVWPSLKKFTLTENMRAKLDPDFSAYLMKVGDGIETAVVGDRIQIPKSMQLFGINHEESLEMLIEFVFPGLFTDLRCDSLLLNNALLTPRNDTVDELNSLLISRFPGEVMVYTSFDETIDISQQGEYGDLIHMLTPSGMPPHELKLKLNCPVMLMRNINPSEGLCNGTRLICKKFDANLILCEIAVGDRKGKKVFIHRIPIIVDDVKQCPILFKRTQFPLRPSFAMTINKAQGQTLDVVGLYLPQPVFSHGQLYVALSRAKFSSSVRVLTAHTFDDEYSHGITLNIVNISFLSKAHVTL